MIRPLPSTPDAGLNIVVHSPEAIRDRMPALTEFVLASAPIVPLSKHPAWLDILRTSQNHTVYAIEAVSCGKTFGFLPLAYVRSMLFGRFLVSLPYLNSNGVCAESAEVQAHLVNRAVELSRELGVRYLELRQETAIDHPDLTAQLTSKVHMRLELPGTVEQLWKGLDSKVRNQVRKGEKQGFTVHWGGHDQMPGFYDVLSENMRDLGTPVYGRRLFQEILSTFPQQAEICLLKEGERPIATSLLLHGWGVSEVPTASSLKSYNPRCANVLMYWKLLERAVERGQRQFDFGRSTTEGSTFKFKKQWGAVPHPAVWQYAVKDGESPDMRPDNPRFGRAIRLWQKLPVRVSRWLGPPIVRGIP